MDPHRPESEEQPNSTSAEDQVSDEECEEPAARSRAHASQNRFDLIKAKTSTGLKKLRSSLGAWRREESVDSTGEPKSRTSTAEPSASKARDDSSTEKSDQEKQTSKQSEYPKVWDLSFDSQAPQSLPAVSQPVRDSFTVDTESREAQTKPTRPRPGDVRSPASLSTAQRFLEEKNPTTPFKYVPQREILPLSLPLPAVPQHKKDPKVIQQAFSPQPPRVPPRPPPRDWVDPLQIQHSAVGRHVLKEAGQVVVDSLAQEVSYTPANPDNTLSSNSLERVVTCKDGIHLSTAHQSDLNQKMQDVEIGSPTGIAQDKTDDQRQSKNKEASYFANGASIVLQTEDKKKGLDKKELGHKEIAPSPPSNRQTQNQMKRVPMNAGCDVNTQSPLYSPFGHGRRDQSSPPVLKVHSKQKRIEPSQKRVIEVNHYVLYDESTSKLPVPSGTAQERPLPSPKFEPIQETAGSVSLKYENSRPTKLLAEAQSALEPSHKLSTPRRSGHPQRDTLSGSIPKPGAPSQNAAEDQCIEEQPKARAVSHHIIPNRPAPKPPSVRSTVVQYPGPMKGYTVSATGATEAHPPPLPPPPLSLRPSAPPVPSPPPRYKYYDVTEPSPYMPTTEPLPEKARGVSPLGSKPAGWRGPFSRTSGSSSGQSGSTGLGLAGLLSSVRLKSNLFRNSMSKQFSSLPTPTGSQDSPGSPADPNRPSTAWIYTTPKQTRSQESIEEEERDKTNMAEMLFGEDIYKVLLIQLACCCCWPIGLASWIIDSTLLQGRRRPSEACIHSMAQHLTWIALLVGISFYFFLMVFSVSLITARAAK